MRDSFPFGIQRLRGMTTSDLTTRRAVVVIIERRQFLRLEREAPIITDHDTDDAASTLLDAVPFRVLCRLYFPSVHTPSDATVPARCVGFGRKRLVVCFVVGAAH